MSILEIIFANFWTWAGTTVLVAVILGGLEGVIEAMRKPERNVRVTTYGDKTCIVQIDNATEDDVRRAVDAAHTPEQACDGWEE